MFDEVKSTLSKVANALVGLVNSQKDMAAQSSASRHEMKDMLDRNLKVSQEQMEKIIDILKATSTDDSDNLELKRVCLSLQNQILL